MGSWNDRQPESYLSLPDIQHPQRFIKFRYLTTRLRWWIDDIVYNMLHVFVRRNNGFVGGTEVVTTMNDLFHICRNSHPSSAGAGDRDEITRRRADLIMNDSV
jgi:hypothetical protein